MPSKGFYFFEICVIMSNKRGIMQQNEQKTSQKSESAIIVETAIATLYWVVVLFALLFATWTLVFPAKAMEFYDEIGNVPRAYDCASQYARHAQGEEGVNARIRSVNYAMALYAQNPDSYAQAVVEETEAFLSSEECVERVKLIDEYNISGTAPVLHPSLYSYADHLLEYNARAKVRLGRIAVTVDGEEVELSKAVTGPASASTVAQISAIMGEMKTLNLTFTAEEISAIKWYIQDFYAESVISINAEVTLKDLYNLYVYGKVALRFERMGLQKPVTTVNYKGTETTPDELYSQLLQQYDNKF